MQNPKCLVLVTLFAVAAAVAASHAVAADTAKTGAAIGGQILDEAGQPIAAAAVSLYIVTVDPGSMAFTTEKVETQTTGADGAYSFARGLDPGATSQVFFMLAEKDGFSLGWANWHPQLPSAPDITLSRPATLAGEVVDKTGQPVADAEVAISFMMIGEAREGRYLMGSLAEERLTVATGADGRFTFARIPPQASAEFVVSAPGYGTHNTFQVEGYGGGGLQFAPGQDDIRIELAPEAGIEGTVVEQDNIEPIPGLRLTVRKGQAWPIEQPNVVITAADGSFRFDGLAAGTYQLLIPTSADQPAEWVAAPLSVPVEAGAATTGVRLQASRGGFVAVTVTDADSEQPLEGAQVMVGSGEEPQNATLATGANGTARFRLAPGQYMIRYIQKQGYTYKPAPEPVTVETGQTRELAIKLSPQPKLRGIVRDMDGEPVAGASVRVLPTGAGREVTSAADGRFEIGWDPNRWGGTQPQMIIAAWHDDRGLAAATEFDEDTDNIEIRLEPGGTLAGRVVDPDANPIADATVTAMLRSSSWNAPFRRDATRTDPEGRYEIKGLPRELAYSVTAQADGYGQTQVQTEIGDDAVPDIELQPANLTVTGVVVDTDGNGVKDVAVYAYGSGQQHRQARTGEDGRFTIDQVCAGEIHINASTSNPRQHGSVRAEGGATDVQVVLGETAEARPPAPRLADSLVGKPLPDLEPLFRATQLPGTPDDNRILVCFWDMNQRPSRHCLKQLAARAAEFTDRSVTVLTVHAAPAEVETLQQWLDTAGISLPVGMVRERTEETCFAWGVRGLPWLILTDQQHVVQADGFALRELDDTLNATGE